MIPNSVFFEQFEVTRFDMVPPFSTTHQLPVLSPEERTIAEKMVYKHKEDWYPISAHHQGLHATPSKFQGLYQALLQSLSQYLKATVIIKTPLDISIIENMCESCESQELTHVHNDWASYAHCLQSVTDASEHKYYVKNHAIGLILPLDLPKCGSGIQLYDVFEGEEAKNIHQVSSQHIPYGLGQATLYCPYQYHAMAHPPHHEYTNDDKRIILQAFLIKSMKNNTPAWHLFHLNHSDLTEASPKGTTQ